MDKQWTWRDGAYIPWRDWHFHRRLFERYGKLVLMPGAYSDMLRQVKDGRAIHLKDDVYAVRAQHEHQGWMWLYIVSTKNGRDIATVYPPVSKWARRREALCDDPTN